MMKKITRSLVLAMAAVSAFTVMGSCGGYEEDYSYTAINPGTIADPTVSREDPTFREVYPTMEKYAEPVTITVAATQYDLESNVKKGTTPENQSFNQIAKKYLNIDLKYEVVASSTYYDSKLNLAIASNKMPDMFYTTSSALYTQLRDGGQLADLSPYFWNLNDELTENYITDMPDVIKTVMDNGKIWALPMLTNTNASAQKLYIRKDWLDICGMEAPKTIDEFVAVGQAFLDNKDKIAAASGISANRVIPFSMNKQLTWQGSFSCEGFFNCFGSSMNAFFEDENGKLYASVTDKNTKAALKTLNEMYSKGILDKEFLSKSAEQVQANVSAGYVGMTFGEWWMPKDALDNCISNVPTSDWCWVDLPSAEGVQAKPVVNRISLTGYNLVSKACKHPEAIVKLINLFYDVYYNDAASEKYVDEKGVSLTLPSNGFYYQYVPIKLWDGTASIREYKRVNEVFNGLYNSGFYSQKRLENGLYQKVLPSEVTADDYQISTTTEGGQTYVNVINRTVLAEIAANETWNTLFNTLRTREKTLHFAEGYPYFVAYKQGMNVQQMTAAEKKGWGIYHEMVDENGSYAYVVALTEGKVEAKYNEFYGANLTAMSDSGDYLNTQTDSIFTAIIKGDKPISAFDSFVKKTYKPNGGDKIYKQINAWYEAQPKNNR